MLNTESYFLLLMQQEKEKFHGLLCYIISHRANIAFAGRKLIKFLQMTATIKNSGQCLCAEVGDSVLHRVPRTGWNRNPPYLQNNHLHLMSLQLIPSQVIHCNSDFHLFPFHSLCIYIKILKPMCFTSVNSTVRENFSNRSVSQ